MATGAALFASPSASPGSAAWLSLSGPPFAAGNAGGVGALSPSLEMAAFSWAATKDEIAAAVAVSSATGWIFSLFLISGYSPSSPDIPFGVTTFR